MRKIGVYIRIFVVSVVVGVAVGVPFLLAGVPNAPMIGAVVTPFVCMTLFVFEKMREEIAEKQKRIDDLTRESEEMKQN